MAGPEHELRGTHCSPDAKANPVAAALPSQYRPEPSPAAAATLHPHPSFQLHPGVRCSGRPPQLRLSSVLGFPPVPPPHLGLQGRVKQRLKDGRVWGSLYFNKIVCSDSYIYTWERGSIYTTWWGYIQERGRPGLGGAAALKPALAKGSVPAEVPSSPTPRRGGNGGTNSARDQVLKRDGKMPCGAARPQEQLRAS